MATYFTKNYSGWDASQAPYLTTDGSELVLNWKITRLNSAISDACGKFSFQIINYELKDSGTDTLDITVSQA